MLSTTFQGDTGQAGAMFDIMSSLSNLIIQDLSIHTISERQFQAAVYHKVGSFTGYEQDSSAWVLRWNGASIGKGSTKPTALNSNLLLEVLANTRISFYVTKVDESYLLYSYGTTVGAIYVQNYDLIIYEGVGIVYPFGLYFGPRIWNGIIHYSTFKTTSPSVLPSYEPSLLPSQEPLFVPSQIPSFGPSRKPSTEPTQEPTILPTMFPTVLLNLGNGAPPPKTTEPTESPSKRPTPHPSLRPLSVPSTKPSSSPSGTSSFNPSTIPTRNPSIPPSTYPSIKPSIPPTTSSSFAPSSNPTEKPSLFPITSEQPTYTMVDTVDLAVTFEGVNSLPFCTNDDSKQSIQEETVKFFGTEFAGNYPIMPEQAVIKECVTSDTNSPKQFVTATIALSASSSNLIGDPTPILIKYFYNKKDEWHTLYFDYLQNNIQEEFVEVSNFVAGHVLDEDCINFSLNFLGSGELQECFGENGKQMISNVTKDYFNHYFNQTFNLVAEDVNINDCISIGQSMQFDFNSCFIATAFKEDAIDILTDYFVKNEYEWKNNYLDWIKDKQVDGIPSITEIAEDNLFHETQKIFYLTLMGVSSNIDGCINPGPNTELSQLTTNFFREMLKPLNIFADSAYIFKCNNTSQSVHDRKLSSHGIILTVDLIARAMKLGVDTSKVLSGYFFNNAGEWDSAYSDYLKSNSETFSSLQEVIPSQVLDVVALEIPFNITVTNGAFTQNCSQQIWKNEVALISKDYFQGEFNVNNLPIAVLEVSFECSGNNDDEQIVLAKLKVNARSTLITHSTLYTLSDYFREFPTWVDGFISKLQLKQVQGFDSVSNSIAESLFDSKTGLVYWLFTESEDYAVCMNADLFTSVSESHLRSNLEEKYMVNVKELELISCTAPLPSSSGAFVSLEYESSLVQTDARASLFSFFKEGNGSWVQSYLLSIIKEVPGTSHLSTLESKELFDVYNGTIDLYLSGVASDQCSDSGNTGPRLSSMLLDFFNREFLSKKNSIALIDVSVVSCNFTDDNNMDTKWTLEVASLLEDQEAEITLSKYFYDNTMLWNQGLKEYLGANRKDIFGNLTSINEDDNVFDPTIITLSLKIKGAVVNCNSDEDINLILKRIFDYFSGKLNQAPYDLFIMFVTELKCYNEFHNALDANLYLDFKLDVISFSQKVDVPSRVGAFMTEMGSIWHNEFIEYYNSFDGDSGVSIQMAYAVPSFSPSATSSEEPSSNIPSVAPTLVIIGAAVTTQTLAAAGAASAAASSSAAASAAGGGGGGGGDAPSVAADMKENGGKNNVLDHERNKKGYFKFKPKYIKRRKKQSKPPTKSSLKKRKEEFVKGKYLVDNSMAKVQSNEFYNNVVMERASRTLKSYVSLDNPPASGPSTVATNRSKEAHEPRRSPLQCIKDLHKENNDGNSSCVDKSYLEEENEKGVDLALSHFFQQKVTESQDSLMSSNLSESEVVGEINASSWEISPFVIENVQRKYRIDEKEEDDDLSSYISSVCSDDHECDEELGEQQRRPRQEKVSFFVIG